jgi:uncharacterized integral membrane protein (TIGR00697 family)
MTDQPISENQDGAARRQYKYFDFIMAAFVTVLLCANIIGPAKACQIGPIVFGAGNLFFPISYLFGDILTEVYGYKKSRRVIWAGFGALVFASIMSYVIVHVPPVKGDAFQAQVQPAVELLFGNTPRLVAASIFAFWIGEFANSFTLAKLKVKTGGKMLWLRTIGSTMVGEGVDTLVFMPMAFYGQMENGTLAKIMLTSYIVKVSWEVLATPITYKVVNALKRAEHEDYFDVNTDFNPFTLKG